MLVAFGLLGVVVAALAAAVAWQGARFERRVHDEARALLAAAHVEAGRPALQDALPAPVRRYAEASGAAAHAPIRTARLRHGGTLRTALDGAWLPIRGVQSFSADAPGFVWWGRARVAPGLWIDARDRSVAGEANMLVRLASTVTLGDARGPELDESALMRLLGEMVWFPTALFDPRWVTWEPADDRSAKATLRVGGRAASVTFTFGEDGLPLRLSALRYREDRGKNVLTPWTGEGADFREVDGLRVPFRMSSIWHVEGRAIPVIRFEAERLEYDVDAPFGPSSGRTSSVR